MRHRRIPRARWRDHSTPNGKHWIEQVRFFSSLMAHKNPTNPLAFKMLDHVNPEHHLRSMIGYHLAWENSLIGMVMVQGKQREVINIGLGIKQVAVEPRDVTVPQYVESLSHKVCGTRFFGYPFFLFTTRLRLNFRSGHYHPNTVNTSRNILPEYRPGGGSRPPPLVHPPRTQIGLH